MNEHDTLVLAIGFTTIVGLISFSFVGWLIWNLFWLAYDTLMMRYYRRRVRRQAIAIVRRNVVISPSARDCYADRRGLTRP
jgi:hypothetical protein